MSRWLSPSEINFTGDQVPFLLENYYSFREGYWPTDPHENVCRRNNNATAKGYFENPLAVAGEMDKRLERCGIDGLICKALYCWHDNPDSLGRMFNLSADEILLRAEAVMLYISGEDFKCRPYHRWTGFRALKNRGNSKYAQAFHIKLQNKAE